jgi:hypothetical protein
MAAPATSTAIAANLGAAIAPCIAELYHGQPLDEQSAEDSCTQNRQRMTGGVR